MTIEELEEIIDLMDYDGICAEIEKRGFRRAGEDGVWEFDLLSLWDKSRYKQDIIKEDKKTCNHFHITLYKDNVDYEGLTFVDVHLAKIHKIKRKFVPIPRKTMIFTDASINEGYLQDINSIVQCDLCGKEYVKKELVNFYDKLVCGHCLRFETDRQVKKEMADIIKRI